MSDGSIALQDSVFAALNGNLTDISSAAVPVYDRPPKESPPAFVRIGEDSHSNSDTKIENGVEHEFEVHVYSGYHGTREVKLVMGQIYAILQRASLTASGFQVTPPMMTFSTEFIEPDGSRGVMRFRSTTIQE